MKMIISGGEKHLRTITEAVITWCVKYFDLNKKDELLFSVKIHPRDNCWGYCEQGSIDRSYKIYIANNQTVRDFVATLAHEMVHVKQWETGKWVGEGEREAARLQYLLADEIWRKGLV